MSAPGSDVTQALAAARAGDPEAVDRLYDAAYAELRRIASYHLRASRSSTLGTTALVHEAYVKLFDRDAPSFADRVHFFAVSARAMRQILVDHFRSRSALKRGGDVLVLQLDEALVPDERRGDLILAVHEALERLAALDSRLAAVVEYKFFGGMTENEIAEVLQLTSRTISNDWRMARAWLATELATPSDTAD